MRLKDLTWRRMREAPDFAVVEDNRLNLMFTDGVKIWHIEDCSEEKFDNIGIVYPSINAWAFAEDVMPPACCYDEYGKTAYNMEGDSDKLWEWLVRYRYKLIGFAKIWGNDSVVVSVEFKSDETSGHHICITDPRGQQHTEPLESTDTPEPLMLFKCVQKYNLEVIPPNSPYQPLG